MSMELVFTPHGSIIAEAPAADGQVAGQPEASSDGRLVKLAEAFAANQAAGLFSLASEKVEAPLPPSFAFWRDFSGRYLRDLCHLPDKAGEELAPLPPPAEITALIDAAPPMRGAEYLTADALAGVWRDLDQWTRAEIAAQKQGLGEFLKQRAPLWRQVGRVCFHLAENKRDPDFPFAFL